MSAVETIESGGHVPLKLKRPFQWNPINGQRSVSPEPASKKRRSGVLKFQEDDKTLNLLSIPSHQTVLILHGARQDYMLQNSYPVPQLKDDRELLVRIGYIGLNPLDWKSVFVDSQGSAC